MCIPPPPVQSQLNSENELDVLSILPKGWQPDELSSAQPYQLVPSTRVTFLARRYRFIIELDLSPSTGIVVSAVSIVAIPGLVCPQNSFF